jgi:hypothetical protein
MEEMMRRWLAANEKAEEERNWKQLADFYSKDAEYTWNTGPNSEFLARGREQIRDWVMGTEMEGLDGWTYPYQKVLIDDRQGEVVAFWKQIAPVNRADGRPYEVAGVGGSWFRYGGNYLWSWQRDFFDMGNATSLFLEMIQASVLSPGMQRRIERFASGEPQPGHVKLGG